MEESFTEDHGLALMFAAGGAACLAIPGWLLTVVMRRVDRPTLVSCYPALLVSGAVLLDLSRVLVQQLERIRQTAAAVQQQGWMVTGSLGMDVRLGVPAAAMATLFLAFVIFQAHRESRARLAFALVLLLSLAGGGAAIWVPCF
jgi:hypothetical protein